jgi:hypothetical protein
MIKKELENMLAWFANGVSLYFETEHSPESVKNGVYEYYKELHTALRKYAKINFANLTDAECDLLGFGDWSNKHGAEEEIKEIVEQMKSCKTEDETNRLLEQINAAKKGVGLRLIPLWLYSQIPLGMELTDIFGKKVIFDGTNDKGTRLGCLAYGIYPVDVKRFDDDRL